MKHSQQIGITATLPVEVIFAAGLSPVDLNNAFIAGANPEEVIARAERSGLPRNTCSWIKGIYSAAHELNITRIIGVTGGDCTNTRALLEIWHSENIDTLEFSFPYPQNSEAMRREIERLCTLLDTSMDAAEEVRAKLQNIRDLASKIDRMTWDGCRITGEENHLLLVGMSDFEGEYSGYEKKLVKVLQSAKSRPKRKGVRIGILGVPPVFSNLHKFIESHGAVVVFNEFQRQFAMLCPADSLAQQYTSYTYPYGTAQRMADINREITTRSIDGIINYVQNFCWRSLTNRLVRDSISVPVLNLEGDKPGPVSGQAATRLEAFIEMLKDNAS